MKPFHKIIVLQQVMAYFLAAGGCDLVWLFANRMHTLFAIIALPSYASHWSASLDLASIPSFAAGKMESYPSSSVSCS
jgi:hypothetical protein